MATLRGIVLSGNRWCDIILYFALLRSTHGSETLTTHLSTEQGTRFHRDKDGLSMKSIYIFTTVKFSPTSTTCFTSVLMCGLSAWLIWVLRSVTSLTSNYGVRKQELLEKPFKQNNIRMLIIRLYFAYF